MGLVKTRRLAAMQKQQRAKAGIKLSIQKPTRMNGSRNAANFESMKRSKKEQ